MSEPGAMVAWFKESALSNRAKRALGHQALPMPHFDSAWKSRIASEIWLLTRPAALFASVN